MTLPTFCNSQGFSYDYVFDWNTKKNVSGVKPLENGSCSLKTLTAFFCWQVRACIAFSRGWMPGAIIGRGAWAAGLGGPWTRCPALRTRTSKAQTATTTCWAGTRCLDCVRLRLSPETSAQSMHTSMYICMYSVILHARARPTVNNWSVVDLPDINPYW